MRLQCALCIVLLGVASMAGAQNCVVPIPFQYEFQNNVTASLSAPSATDPCALSVAVNGAAGPTTAGFLHYQRAKPLASVRYGFRVDASALSNFTLVNRQLLIFTASSPAISQGTSHVLEIRLHGATPNPALSFVSGTDGVSPLSTAVALSQPSNVIRFEINVGSGTAGSVRYWINHAFSDPPDGVIDRNGAGLNNAAFLGVVAAEIGLSSPTALFRAEQADHALIFDQIESNDDVLFFDDFSRGMP
jgi:hypothetical protein